MFRPTLILALATAVLLAPMPTARAEEMYPRHVTAKSADAVKRGLAYLAKTQAPDGNWTNAQDGAAYPITMASLAGMAFLANGNTAHRGPYADNVAKVIQYLVANQQANGLITGPTQEQGRPMYGHGFGLMFLASSYGGVTDERTRKTMRRVIENAVTLTARGQSNLGGWTYTPGGGDEGSVTVTQIQGLRAAQNAGFTVPKGTIAESVKYLERCRCPDGGICYSFGSGPESRPAISCAALATLYNAGEYESTLSEGLLEYVNKLFQMNKGTFNITGHDFYTHLYASQALYQTGDKNWDQYFPSVRDMLLKMQAADGSWEGDGIGPVFGTSVACVVLQLPYKYLPIYQR
jgi:prenyltransferase beta subunit